MLECPEGKFLRSFGDRFFGVTAPKLWNEIAQETALKTHFFKSAFQYLVL